MEGIAPQPLINYAHAQTPASFCPKVVSRQATPQAQVVYNTKFEVTSFNGCPKLFLDTSLALTPANFGPKSCFFVSYSPSPS